MSKTSDKQSSRLSSSLDNLRQAIINKEYLKHTGSAVAEGWGGAGVLFSTERVVIEVNGFYPAPELVVTPHAHAVGWLLNNLGSIFSTAKLIDHQSKHAFYARLADAAIQYQQSLAQQKESADEMLLAIHSEAQAIAVE